MRELDAVLEKLVAAWGTVEKVITDDHLTRAWRKRAVTIQRKINDLHSDILDKYWVRREAAERTLADKGWEKA